MYCALNLYQDIGNNNVSTYSGYDNHSCTDFLFHQGLNQIDSSTNLLDELVLTGVVTQQTKKTRSVGPHKLIPKKN